MNRATPSGEKWDLRILTISQFLNGAITLQEHSLNPIYQNANLPLHAPSPWFPLHTSIWGNSFSANTSFYSWFRNTFSIAERISVSASRWCSGQDSVKTLKIKTLLKPLKDAITKVPCLPSQQHRIKLPICIWTEGTKPYRVQQYKQYRANCSRGKVALMNCQQIYSTTLLGICVTWCHVSGKNTTVIEIRVI